MAILEARKLYNYRCLVCSWCGEVPANAEERMQTAVLKLTLVVAIFVCPLNYSGETLLLLRAGSVT